MIKYTHPQAYKEIHQTLELLACNPCHLLFFCHVWQHVLRLTGPLRNTVYKANSRGGRRAERKTDYDSCHIVLALSQASD